MAWTMWIAVGLVAGLAAELLLGARGGGIGPTRLITATALGLLGALLGGLASVRLGFGDITGFDLRSVIIATIGAVAVVWTAHLVTQRG